MTTAAEIMNSDETLPLTVRQYLQKNAVDYTTLGRRQLQDKTVVECVLLADDMGRLQVFLPDNRLLDLATLRQQTGRELVAAGLAEQRQVRRRLGVEEFVALDELHTVETIIDESVPTSGPVCIRGGTKGLYIELADAGKLALNAHTRRVNASATVPEVDLDYELSLFDLDRDAIEDSVSRFTAKRIRQRLEETLEIPPLPDIAQEIIRLRVDPNADINKLSSLVERDPSLAAQVISWASSSYYAAPGSVKSVQDAIFRVLGYDLVMNLALGLALGRTLDMPKDCPAGYTPYWQEAVFTAAAVAELQALIPKTYRPSFGLVYLSGLLHNFGYLVLAHVFKPHFSTCCRLWEANPHLEPQIIEDHVLGLNRNQIAANLLRSWNLPSEVCLALRHSSHSDYFGVHSDYSQLVLIATRLLRRTGMVSGPRQTIDPLLFSNLHIDPDEAIAAMNRLAENRGHLEALARGMDS